MCPILLTKMKVLQERNFFCFCSIYSPEDVFRTGFSTVHPLNGNIAMLNLITGVLIELRKFVGASCAMTNLRVQIIPSCRSTFDWLLREHIIFHSSILPLNCF